jgi:outer membrane protein TolC
VKYYPTALVGVTVNATLFDGLQNHYKMDQIRLQIQQAKNTREQAENGLQLEALNARTTLSNALLSVQSQKSNLVMAEDVARVTKIKYQQGVGSSLEVMNAETSLKEAQTNYLSALYDAYMAGVTYKKAMGSLIP